MVTICPIDVLLKITYYLYRNFYNNLLKPVKQKLLTLTNVETQNKHKIIRKFSNISSHKNLAEDLLNISPGHLFTSDNIINQYFAENGSRLVHKIRETTNLPKIIVTLTAPFI